MVSLLYGSYSISVSVLQPINETLIAKHKKQKIGETVKETFRRILGAKCESDISNSKKILCTKLLDLITDFSSFGVEDFAFLIKYGSSKYTAIDDASKHCARSFSPVSFLQRQNFSPEIHPHGPLFLHKTKVKGAAELTQIDGESCDDFIDRKDKFMNLPSSCDLVKEATVASQKALSLAHYAENERGWDHQISIAGKTLEAAAYAGAAANGALLIGGVFTGDIVSNAASAASAVLDAVEYGADMEYNFAQAEVLSFEIEADKLLNDVSAIDQCVRPNSGVLQCEMNGVKMALDGFVITTNAALNRLEFSTKLIEANVRATMKDVRSALSKLNVITGRLQNAIYHEAIQRLVDLRTKFQEESSESVKRYFQFNNKQSNGICNTLNDIKSDTEHLLTYLKKSILVPSELENTLLYFLRPDAHDEILWGSTIFSHREASVWRASYVTEYVYLYDLARFSIGVVSQSTRGVLNVLSYADTLVTISKSYVDSLQFINKHVGCIAGFHIIFLSDTYTCRPNICTCSKGVPAYANTCPVHGEEMCTECNSGYILDYAIVNDIVVDYKICTPVCVCPPGRRTWMNCNGSIQVC